MTSAKATAIAAGSLVVFFLSVLGFQYFSVNRADSAVSEGASQSEAEGGSQAARNIETPEGESVPSGLVLQEDVGDLQVKAYVNDKQNGSVLEVWQDKEHPVKLFQLPIDNDVKVALKKITPGNGDGEPTALIPLVKGKADFVIVETAPVVARKYQASVLVVERTKASGLESVSLLGVLPESIEPLELQSKNAAGPYQLVVRPSFAQMTGASAVDQKVILRVEEEKKRKGGQIQNALILDWKAMRAHAMSKKDLADRARSVEAAFSSFSGLPLGAESDEDNTVVQDPQSLVAQVPVELTETVLQLYCAGQGSQVKGFVERSWPADKQGKNEFLTAIKSLADKDKLWSEVLAGPAHPRKTRLF